MSFSLGGLATGAAKGLAGYMQGQQAGAEAKRQHSREDEDRQQRLQMEALQRALTLSQLSQQGIHQGTAPGSAPLDIDLTGLPGGTAQHVDLPGSTRYEQLTPGFYQDQVPHREAQSQSRAAALLDQAGKRSTIAKNYAEADKAGRPGERNIDPLSSQGLRAQDILEGIRERHRPKPATSATPGTDRSPAPKPPTDEQAKAEGFRARAQAAEAQLATPHVPNWATRAASGIPLIGGTAGNFFQTPDEQTFVQAGRDFIAAVLRRESGAAISPSEFENYARIFLPQPNDKPAVLAQKARSRANAIAALGLSAGSAAGKLDGGPTAPPDGEAPVGNSLLDTLDDLKRRYLK